MLMRAPLLVVVALASYGLVVLSFAAVTALQIGAEPPPNPGPPPSWSRAVSAPVAAGFSGGGR